MCWIWDSSLVLGLQLKILICGVAAEQQQQQQTVCGSACHKWRVLINTSALFSVFLPFLFWLFEKKCHGAKSVKTGSVYFHTWTAVDYYASPKGDKIEKKIYKKTPLLGAQNHQTKVWTWCLSKPHTKISTWVQLFVIILQHGCQHLGNFSSCWYQSKVRKKKAAKQTTPTSAAEAVHQLHKLLHGAEDKNHTTTACHSAAVPHERNHPHFLCSLFLPSLLLLPHCMRAACMESHLKMGVAGLEKEVTG